MRILVAAPYPRDRGHGGSMRTTAIADRLEQRGAHVDWWVVPGRRRGAARKAAELVRLVPGQMAAFGRDGRPPGSWDVVLAAMSYLGPQALEAPAPVRWIDFSNLEWQHLLDVAGLTGGVRRPRLRLEARMMRRQELRAARTAEVVTAVGEPERAWLAGHGVEGPVVVPNALPAAARREAEAIAARRRVTPAQPVLAYVGTLAFPPNVLSLRAWLAEVWPSLRRRRPSLRLRVAGDVAPADRPALERFAGVEVLGFVADLGPVLADAAALVMPFGGRAGTSLRVPYAAATGVPLIGSEQALRGFGESGGHRASSPAEWAEAVEAALRGDLEAARLPEPDWPDAVLAQLDARLGRRGAAA